MILCASKDIWSRLIQFHTSVNAEYNYLLSYIRWYPISSRDHFFIFCWTVWKIDKSDLFCMGTQCFLRILGYLKHSPRCCPDILLTKCLFVGLLTHWKMYKNHLGCCGMENIAINLLGNLKESPLNLPPKIYKLQMDNISRTVIRTLRFQQDLRKLWSRNMVKQSELAYHINIWIDSGHIS